MLRYLLGLQGDRFDFESEMIIDAVRGGMTYAEVPIRCIYGKEWKSHYHPLRDSLEFFAMAWRKRRR
jgi:hypothetical protein